MANPYYCIFLYNYNIYSIGDLLDANQNIEGEEIKGFSIHQPYQYFRLSGMIFRVVHLSLFSNYELIMMDILVVCYLRFPKIKEKFHERASFNGLKEEKIIQKLKSYYYNNFEEVEDLFITLLNVRIPDYKFLKDAFIKRNDIVHRYNFSEEVMLLKYLKMSLKNLFVK